MYYLKLAHIILNKKPPHNAKQIFLELIAFLSYDNKVKFVERQEDDYYIGLEALCPDMVLFFDDYGGIVI